MAVRNVSKSKKSRAARTTKHSRKSRPSSPDDLPVSPVIVIPDQLDYIATDDIEVLECGDEMMDGTMRDVSSDDFNADSQPLDEAATDGFDESVSTINSLQASPVEEIKRIRLSLTENYQKEKLIVKLDEIAKEANDLQSTPSSSIFTKLFGGFNLFSRSTPARNQIQPLKIPPRTSEMTTLEVIHIFQEPSQALGHEGLMIRRRERLRRSSIKSIADSVKDCIVDVPYRSVSEMPPGERVVLLTQIVSPRVGTQSQEAIINKATSRPDLWVFLPFSYCKVHYAIELCEYMNRRCSWPSSRAASPEKGLGTPQTNTLVPQETPLVDFVPNDIPPNSIDAPLKAQHRPLSSDLESSRSNNFPYTPVTLPTPPKLEPKQNDVHSIAIDDENMSPVA